jgi:FAD/FMN-containing dehydrogenase
VTKLTKLHRKGTPVLEVDDALVDELSRTLAARIEGEVRFEAGDRALYASDASNYRMPPIGVVVPKSVEDVVRTIEVCRRVGAPIVSRGGGTSLAGQCCNHAVVIDWSKYLRDRIEIDPHGRRARVSPGVVLDELNRHAARHGLVFAPDPATHTHCTLGGMIGNDSCGVHSVQSEFYGPGVRTDAHVEELEVLTYDGLRMRVGRTSDTEYARILGEGGRRAEIYRGLRELAARYAPLIRARFPDIPRRVSGYNLPALLPENGFHVARSLVGSESTCVTVLDATVKLGRAFPHRALLILGYEDLGAAGDDVMRVRALDPRPIGMEGLDPLLVDFIRKKALHAEHLHHFPDGSAWLLVELGADSPEEAERVAREAEAALKGRTRRWPTTEVVLDPREQGNVWQIRESGLGATAFVPGMPDAWPGWEDSAVAPERLGGYLRALKALLERHDYVAALYGHFGQGCLHTRIPFDLNTSSGIAKYRDFTRDAAELVVRFGGSLSGEHGDGQARGDLLPVLYGPELVQAFRELKAIWDPDGKMNPGKVVDALRGTRTCGSGPIIRNGSPRRAWPSRRTRESSRARRSAASASASAGAKETASCVRATWRRSRKSTRRAAARGSSSRWSAVRRSPRSGRAMRSPRRSICVCRARDASRIVRSMSTWPATRARSCTTATRRSGARATRTRSA